MSLRKSIPEKGDKKRIILVGGGFAGLEFIKALNNKDYQLIFLDKNNYYQFQPLLYQVATGGLEPGSISYPLRRLVSGKKNIHFRMCTVESIDPQNKMITTDKGKVEYDFLVLATGCTTNYFGDESLEGLTYPLKTVAEAISMRNRVLASFEGASLLPAEEQKPALTFVVVGGGATGVELAGALGDLKRCFFPTEYREIDPKKIEIHLIDGMPRLLSGMPEKASAIAEKTLQQRGVTLHLNTLVKEYDGLTVRTTTGLTLESKNVFWVAGIKPVSFPGLDKEAYDRGRIVVDTFHRVKGYEAIFALGDVAYMPTEENPKGFPQVAQVAMQMGENLAKNMNALANGTPPKAFLYKDKGSMATIGRNSAAVELKNVVFGGRIAWWLWLLVHIFSIVGVRNKATIFIDWAWHYLTYDSSLQTLVRPDKPKKQ